MNSMWLVVLLAVVAVLSLARVVTQWRRYSRRHVADWDEQFIMQLRRAGVNAFSDHLVDFFFTLPDEAGCDSLCALLQAEGFQVGGRSAVEGGGYSLNLQKSMRLIVPEMQACTARFKALAQERGGSYDSWAVARPAQGPGAG